MINRARLFIFDCDGTLADSQATIVALMQRAFSQCGLAPPPPADIRRQIGLSLEVAIARLCPSELPLPLSEIAVFYRKAARAMREEPDLSEQLFPGVKDLLEELRRSHHYLAVATGKNLAGLQRTLDRHGMSDWFHTLQTADRCLGKPHPDMILKAMADTNMRPEDTIMIGDTTFDIEMARAAGALAVGVSWGYHDSRDLKEAGAHHIIDHPGDLLRHVAIG